MPSFSTWGVEWEIPGITQEMPLFHWECLTETRLGMSNN